MEIKIKKDTIKTFFLVVGVVVVVSLFVFLITKTGSGTTVLANGESVIMENGNQVLIMKAQTGYSPNSFDVKANTESVLRIQTKNTYDCSTSVVIPALNVSKVLPPTGSTDIALGSQKEGTVINGSCGMGMYRFKIKFS